MSPFGRLARGTRPYAEHVLGRLLSGSLVFLAVTQACAADDVLENGRRPLQWRVGSRTALPDAQVAAIGARPDPAACS